MKQNTKIFIGLALPIVVVLIVLGSVLIPKLFFNPVYDFVYGVGGQCDNNVCSISSYYDRQSGWYPYKVVDGKIVKDTHFPTVTTYEYINDKSVPIKKPVEVSKYPELYIYHVATDTFARLSEAEIAQLKVSNGGSAPDGTVVTNNERYNRGIVGEILGGGYSSEGLYLKNGSYTKKIIVKNGGDSYYSRDFNFLGWVTK